MVFAGVHNENLALQQRSTQELQTPISTHFKKTPDPEAHRIDSKARTRLILNNTPG